MLVFIPNIGLACKKCLQRVGASIFYSSAYITVETEQSVMP